MDIPRRERVMGRFIKKPVVVDAAQLTERIVIDTLEGQMTGEPGDWLITGVRGEKYPCKRDIFEATYEPVGESANGGVSMQEVKGRVQGVFYDRHTVLVVGIPAESDGEETGHNCDYMGCPSVGAHNLARFVFTTHGIVRMDGSKR